MLEIFSDPKVMRFWGTVPWSSRDEALERIAKDAQRLEDGTDLRLGLERRADAAFLGTCTLFDLNAQCRRAEIGYCLASTAWGQGYMHEALTSLIQYGFEQLDLNRIEADIDPRNEASARSLERLGFRREGLLRERWIVGAEVSDTALYGLLRADWLARPKAAAMTDLSADHHIELRRLEEAMWRGDTRFDRAFQEARFAPDFVEFGRSGRVYLREQALITEPHPIRAVIPLPEFNVRLLDTNTAQVTYNSHVTYDGVVEYAHRSSIWSRTPAGWVMRFHQGTPYVP